MYESFSLRYFVFIILKKLIGMRDLSYGKIYNVKVFYGQKL